MKTTLVRNSRFFGLMAMCLLVITLVTGCQRPQEEIPLRTIKDVVVDATTDPTLKANAVFYNPNKMRGKLKNIDVEIFVNGKKAANVKQKYNEKIPAQSERSEERRVGKECRARGAT